MMWFFFFSLFVPQNDVPTFIIENIEVVGDTNPNLIQSVSLIELGQPYGESDLRIALGRIQKLPIIHYCDFRLKRGSERGRYVLVIQVEEIKPITFGVFGVRIKDAVQRRQDFDIVDPNIQMGFNWLRTGEWLGYGAAGIERENGENDYSRFFNFGVSYYNLFNRNILANLNITAETEFFEETQYAGTLKLAIPLGQNRSLQPILSYTQTQNEEFLGFLAGRDDREYIEEWGLGLSYEWNTTDDGLYPNSGHRLNFTGSLTQANFFYSAISQTGEDDPWDETALVFSFEAEKYKPVFGDITLWAGGGTSLQAFANNLPNGLYTDLYLGSDEETAYRRQAYGLLGFSTPAWPFHKNFNSVRFIGEIGYEYQELSQIDFKGRLGDFERFMATIGVTYRPKWAVVELTLFYEHLSDEEGSIWP